MSNAEKNLSPFLLLLSYLVKIAHIILKGLVTSWVPPWLLWLGCCGKEGQAHVEDDLFVWSHHRLTFHTTVGAATNDMIRQCFRSFPRSSLVRSLLIHLHYYIRLLDTWDLLDNGNSSIIVLCLWHHHFPQALGLRYLLCWRLFMQVMWESDPRWSTAVEVWFRPSKFGWSLISHLPSNCKLHYFTDTPWPRGSCALSPPQTHMAFWTIIPLFPFFLAWIVNTECWWEGCGSGSTQTAYTSTTP